MPTETRTLRSTLGQLGLALLNATLLLALALVVAGLLLLGRVENAVADTAARAAREIGPEAVRAIADDLGRLSTALDRIDGLEARLAAADVTVDGPALEELRALRRDVATLTAAVTTLRDTVASLKDTTVTGLREALHQLFAQAAAAIAQPTEAE